MLHCSSKLPLLPLIFTHIQNPFAAIWSFLLAHSWTCRKHVERLHQVYICPSQSEMVVKPLRIWSNKNISINLPEGPSPWDFSLSVHSHLTQLLRTCAHIAEAWPDLSTLRTSLSSTYLPVLGIASCAVMFYCPLVSKTNKIVVKNFKQTLHEQSHQCRHVPFHAHAPKVHLFQLCQGQESVPCLSASNIDNTRQTNWTLESKVLWHDTDHSVLVPPYMPQWFGSLPSHTLRGIFYSYAKTINRDTYVCLIAFKLIWMLHFDW